MSWESGRPIYDRLPGEQGKYTENDGADWLTRPWDDALMQLKGKIDSVYRDYLDPATARIDALDWLAQLAGYTGEYWDAAWPVAIKRTLIAQAFIRIWPLKGSKQLLEYLLSLFSIPGVIFLFDEFYADINVAGDPLGGRPWVYYIKLPLTVLRDSQVWLLAEKLNRLYGPVYCFSMVCYEHFYADFSVAGEPIFD